MPTEALFTPLHSGEGETGSRAHPEIKAWRLDTATCKTRPRAHSKQAHPEIKAWSLDTGGGKTRPRAHLK